MLLIDFTVIPPVVKRIVRVDVPWMGKRWRVTNKAEIHSMFDGIEKQLETFRTTPEAFEVWKGDDEPEAA